MAIETTENQTSSTGATVLVAEDEVLIRFDISDYLRSHGYNVIEANSAAEAIQVLKSEVEVALVFTDVRMPGTVDGIDLARYVQKHHPAIPVVMTSGHVLPTEVPEDLGPFIEKPYNRARVLETIKEQLRQRTNR